MLLGILRQALSQYLESQCLIDVLTYIKSASVVQLHLPWSRQRDFYSVEEALEVQREALGGWLKRAEAC